MFGAITAVAGRDFDPGRRLGRRQIASALARLLFSGFRLGNAVWHCHFRRGSLRAISSRLGIDFRR